MHGLPVAHRQRMAPAELKRRLVEREVILRFAVEIYVKQLAAGRHFLHEHPRGASSWEEPFIWVDRVVGDHCRYGLRIGNRNHRLRQSGNGER